VRKNTAGQHIAFQMNSATDGSAVTSGTPTVYYTIDGGTQATGGGTSTHEGNGQWSYAPAQAETNGNHVAFTMAISGAISQTVNAYPLSTDLQTTSTPTVNTTQIEGSDATDQINAACDTALTDYDAVVPADLPTNFGSLGINGSGHVSRVTLVDTTTTNTDMRGTDSAYTGTPPTAGAIADAVLDEALSGHTSAGTLGKAVADIETDATAILADTNELQTDDVPGLIATAQADLDTITGSDGVTLATTQGNYAPATAAALATVDTVVDGIQTDLSNGTDGLGALKTLIDAVQTAVDALNDPTIAAITSSVLTTQMTESYAANGTAPTLAQALFAIHQKLMQTKYTGTSSVTYQLDNSTTAFTGTLDSSSTPTEDRRA